MKKLIHKALFWLALACPFIGTIACWSVGNEPEPEGVLPAFGAAVGQAAAQAALFVSFYCLAVLLAIASLVVSLIRKDKVYVWASLALLLLLLTEIVLSSMFESYMPLLLRLVT